MNVSDSFFAAQENNIIQLVFNPDVSLFTAIRKIDIPSISCIPAQIFFEDNVLIISSLHGALSAFEIEEDKEKLVYSSKGQGCALSAVQMSDNQIARYEAGIPMGCISIYTHRPFALQKQIQIKGKVQEFFYFADGFIVSTMSSTVFMRDGVCVSSFSIPNDFIIYHSINPSKTAALILTFNGMLYKVDIYLNLMPIKIDPASSKLILRTHFISDDIFLICMKGRNHEVWSLNYPGQDGEMTIARIPVSINSLVGLESINYYKEHPLACLISSCANQITVIQRGLQSHVNVLNLNPPINEDITNIFVSYRGDKASVLITTLTTSQIYDFDNSQGRPALVKNTSIPCIEDEQTLAAGDIQTSDGPKFIQITKKHYQLSTDAKRQEIIANMAVMSNQSALLASKDRFLYIDYQNKKNVPFDYRQFENEKAITAIAVSPRHGTLFAYGLKKIEGNDEKSYIVIRSIEDANDIHEEEMPKKIRSIKFFGTHRICLGLYDGHLVCITLENRRPTTRKQIFIVGSEPVLFADINDCMCLALSSQTWLVNDSANFVNIKQIGTNKFCCAMPIHKKGLILSPIQRTLYAWCYSPQSEELKIANFKEPRSAHIIHLFQIPKTPYLIYATTDKIYVSDINKITFENPVENLPRPQPEEKILLMAMSPCEHDQIIFSVAIGNIKSYYRLYSIQCSIQNSQPQRQSYNPNSPQPISPQAQCTQSTHLAVCARSTIINGRLTAMSCSLRFIACACDNVVTLFRTMDPNKSGLIQKVAQISDVGISIRTMSFLILNQESDLRREYEMIAAGDIQRSYILLKFNHETCELSAVAEEGVCRQITALTPIPSISSGRFLGGDALGNVFITDFATRDSLSSKSEQPNFPFQSRAPVKWCINVGDVVTGLNFSQKDSFNIFWYATVGGGIGSILQINQKQNDIIMFKHIESEMQRFYYEKTKFDHIAYRSKNFPSFNLIDFDIVKAFSKLSEKCKIQIADSIRQRNGLRMTAENLSINIEDAIIKYDSYFAQWGVI